MKKALVTGAGGFVGSHLVEHLLNNGISVTAIVHPAHPSNNLKSLVGKIVIEPADLTRKNSLKKLLGDNFDYIFHLAAFASPAQSFTDPQNTLKNNVFSQVYLLELLVKKKSRSKILIVGSAEEYGNVGRKYLPVNENTPFMPMSPYAVSKIAQDMIGYQYFLNYGLNIIRVRPFNHIGPRQSDAFVVPAFASQIASLEKVGKGEIKVGNLNKWRDFTDVRDIVKAYLLALQKGKVGEVYNLGSGKAIKIADILKKLVSFSKTSIKVQEDKSRLRTSDVEKIYCDFSKFNKDTGWRPTISIEQTLFDTIEFERNKLKK